MTPEVYYREKHVLAHFAPVSRTTWWRWVKSGHAPAPIKLGERITVWRGSELERWMLERRNSGDPRREPPFLP